MANWTLYYKPGPNDGSWAIAQLKEKVSGLSWWNARVYLDIYHNYPMDSVIYAENENGKRMFPTKANKMLTDFGTLIGA